MSKKFNKRSPRNKNISKTKKTTLYDYQGFKDRHANKLLITACVLLILFLTCLFKNISYPLFWADESMTAIGSERVIKYGYPKVHDGKNVFYDLKHSNPTLGINEKDDAYIGGTGWGHYYYGVVGYKLAEMFEGLYAKTGIYRASFAMVGLAGLLLFAFIISRFFADKFTKYAFMCIFILFELLSISLLLLMREVRYYPLTIFLCCLIAGLYIFHRFNKPLNKTVYIIVFATALWLLFVTFSPAYFILLLSIGLSEAIIAINHYFKMLNLRAVVVNFILSTLPLLISLIIVFPLFYYFKTFEISKAMSDFAGYNSEMYWNNVSTVLKYFINFELFLLALFLKILVTFNYKKIKLQNDSMFSVSLFLSLVYVIYVFAISVIPNFIYTRYIIYIQPFLCVVIILDLFLLLAIFSQGSRKMLNAKMMLLCVASLFLFLYPVKNNTHHISGYIQKTIYPYRGPLDYIIPYIKEQFPRTDNLIIATNYEETSYMYYLKSKVVVGFVGNNLEEDSEAQPHIISYRKRWGNYVDIFASYLRKASYERIVFPVYDSPINNIPELNFKPAFNHKFETMDALNEQVATQIFILEK